MDTISAGIGWAMLTCEDVSSLLQIGAAAAVAVAAFKPWTVKGLRGGYMKTWPKAVLWRHRATCQILPPNFQGYEPFCPWLGVRTLEIHHLPTFILASVGLMFIPGVDMALVTRQVLMHGRRRPREGGIGRRHSPCNMQAPIACLKREPLS